MMKAVFADTLKKNRNMLLLFLFTALMNLGVFRLYHILNEALIYACCLSGAFCLLLLVLSFIATYRKHKELQRAAESGAKDFSLLPEPETGEERAWREIVDSLCRELENRSLSYRREKQDAEDWYTTWIHQIKTPIAVLKLRLPEERELSNELFRIEEYAELALSYIRLGSEQNDLVIREYPLDELIRDTIRKYAPLFIAAKLKLDYIPTEQTVITDKKWFTCILEQLISNAIKYTPSGTITISANEDSLTVSDTGIGIAPEDLPRIFEKGYTGRNGRLGAKSSGLGLYLSAKAAKLLQITLSAESTPNQGSRFTLRYPQPR